MHPASPSWNSDPAPAPLVRPVVPRSPGLHYGFTVLALIVLAVFGSLGLARFGYTSILPAMQENLGLTNTQAGELQSWNLAGYVLTVMLAGWLATRYGPRIVIACALGLVGGALILTGLVPTFNGARAGRFLAGVGGAGANVPAMGLISAWFGARRRGLAAGAGVAGSSLGLMVTGPLIPVILAQHGPDRWRVCWYVLGVMAFLVCGLCAWRLRNQPAALGLRPLGAPTEVQAPTVGPLRPELDWSRLWRSRLLWHLAMVFFAFGVSYIIYSTFFVRYLVKERGFTPARGGALWMQVGMLSVLSGFLWGSLSDRWGRRIVLVGVFVLQGSSFLIFGLSRGGWGVYMSAILFALTAWSIPALMAALAGDMFGARLAPAALGLITVVFGLGQVLGPLLAGVIADATRSFSLAFILAGLVAWTLGGGGSYWLRLPTTPRI